MACNIRACGVDESHSLHDEDAIPLVCRGRLVANPGNAFVTRKPWAEFPRTSHGRAPVVPGGGGSGGVISVIVPRTALEKRRASEVE